MHRDNSLYMGVLEFLKKNYAEVLDLGLMDDILFNEYKTCVNKLIITSEKEESEKRRRWLDFIINQMFECSKDNLKVGRSYTLYINYLKLVDLYVA